VVVADTDGEPPPPTKSGAFTGAVFRLGYVLPVDDDDVRTESQKEWANCAAHGYRKLYQPRSMLWFGGIFCTLFIALLLVVFTGRWP
jgi:hypothetical protein